MSKSWYKHHSTVMALAYPILESSKALILSSPRSSDTVDSYPDSHLS